MFVRRVHLFLLFALIHQVYPCPIPFNIQSKCRCAITEAGRVYIYCARKQLTAIPHFNNSNIIFDELVLSGNRISTVHKNAFNGLKLRKLELQANPISSIEQQAFVDLANYLEELILSTTALTTQLTSQTLMQILTELPNLKRLSLRLFDLSTLIHSGPRTALILRKLTQLSLQACAIGQPESKDTFLQMFPNLERLDLSENRFEYFDRSLVSSLKKLKVLNLSKNKIRHFSIDPSLPSTTIKPSNSLIELDLSYNGIETIDEHIFESISSELEILNLRNNELTTEKQLAFLVHLTRLREFYLDYNRLESIDQVTLPLNLKVFSLKNNRLNQLELSVFVRLEYLEKLFLSSNKLTKLAPTLKTSFPSLEVLELDRNQVSFLPAFNAPKLKQFNLDGNFLGRKIDRRLFANLPLLERLHLRDNQIETIDQQAFENTRLQSLDLRNNSLQSLPLWVKLNGTLQVLSLRRNQLCSIDQQALNFYRSLVTLELDQNPLHCDCRVARNFQQVKLTGQCESPPERRTVNLNDLPHEQFACSILTMPQCTHLAKTVTEYSDDDTTTTSTSASTATTTMMMMTEKTTSVNIVEQLVEHIYEREESSSTTTTTTSTESPSLEIVRIADFTIAPLNDRSQLLIQWQLYPSAIEEGLNNGDRRVDLKRHQVNGFKISSTFPKYQMSELLDVLQRNYTLDYVQHGEICLYLLRTTNYEKLCKQLHISSTQTVKSSLIGDPHQLESWYSNEPTKSVLIGSLLGILLVLILLACVILIITRCPSVFFCHLRPSKYHQSNDSKSESLLVRPTPTNTIPWPSQSHQQKQQVPFYPHSYQNQHLPHSLRPASYQASLLTQCTCPTHYHSSGSSSTGTGFSCPQGPNYHIYQEIPNEDCHAQNICQQYRTYRSPRIESNSPSTLLSTQTTTTSSEQCQLCSLSVLV